MAVAIFHEELGKATFVCQPSVTEGESISGNSETFLILPGNELLLAIYAIANKICWVDAVITFVTHTEYLSVLQKLGLVVKEGSTPRSGSQEETSQRFL